MDPIIRDIPILLESKCVASVFAIVGPGFSFFLTERISGKKLK